jgi:hypothetical protein
VNRERQRAAEGVGGREARQSHAGGSHDVKNNWQGELLLRAVQLCRVLLSGCGGLEGLFCAAVFARRGAAGSSRLRLRVRFADALDEVSLFL